MKSSILLCLVGGVKHNKAGKGLNTLLLLLNLVSNKLRFYVEPALVGVVLSHEHNFIIIYRDINNIFGR